MMRCVFATFVLVVTSSTFIHAGTYVPPYAECEDFEDFQICASSCEPTCKDPSPMCIKETRCMPKCTCPKETPIRENGRCIALQDCPPPCPGETIYRSCSTLCPATCTNPFPQCVAVCGPPDCQCPPEAPIRTSIDRCVTDDQCGICNLEDEPDADCKLNCPYGLDFDFSGCEVCSCFDPCVGDQCPFGTMPEPVVVNCVVAPCIPPAICECRACPQVRCSTRCPLGFKHDEFGCQTCQCDDPCEDLGCSSDEICDLTPIVCITLPCFPIPGCREQVCGSDRPLKDDFGNDYECDAEKLSCPEGFECNLDAQVCCPSTQCFLPPDSGTCPDLVNRYFYDFHSEECRVFPFGCGGNENNFETMADCQAACGCGDFVCDLKCAVFEVDEDGCPICECAPVDPCALVLCPIGTRCEDGTCVPDCDEVECPEDCIFGCKRLPFSNCFTSECNDFDRCIVTICPVGTSCLNGECIPFACEEAVCPADCELGCLTDAQTGCETDKCNDVDPCAAVTCIFGFICVKGRCVLKENPVCGIENPVICTLFCENGFVTGPNGCPLCECQTGCEGVQCPEGVPCENGMCLDACQAECSEFLKCPAGVVEVAANCFDCRCRAGCGSAVECLEGEVCVLQPVVCVRAPCNPIPVCTKDVCSIGGPLTEFGGVRDCGQVEEGEQKCPPGYNCLDDDGDGTSNCCPGRTCDLPPDSGTGTDFELLWYYSREAGDCVNFLYGGVGGNENRFTSQISCRRECVCLPKPCPPPQDGSGSCEFGLAKDELGCDNCNCLPDPCDELICSGGSVCYVLTLPDDVFGVRFEPRCFDPCPEPFIFNPDVPMPQFCCTAICGPDPACPCTFEDSEPRCVCPPETPIFVNGDCISEDECPPSPVEVCPEGQEFSFDVTCLLTCNSPREVCNALPRPGCKCSKEAPLLLDGECVPPEECPDRCLTASAPTEPDSGCEVVKCDSNTFCAIDAFGLALCCPNEPQECPKDQELVPDISCPFTCISPLVLCLPPPEPVPGCQCKEEKPILQNGECVTTAECENACQFANFDASNPACAVVDCVPGKGCAIDLFGNVQCCPLTPEQLCPSARKPGPDDEQCHVVDCLEDCLIDQFNQAVCCPFAPPKPVLCTAPADVGPCDSVVPSWFYNVETAQCDQFDWGGCGGNTNRFETQDECQKNCGSICKDPLKVGPCEALVPRYFYNADSGRCEDFKWGGCEANNNNFMSLHECQVNCVGDVNPCEPYGQPLEGKPGEELFCGRGGERCPDESKCVIAPDDSYAVCCGVDCQAPPDSGPCEGWIQSWFYNIRSGRCEKFEYGGCLGNTNRFSSKKDCKRSCGNICSLPPETGNCRAAILRYYYNPKSGRCETFSWGGCGGNANKFETLEACRINCYPDRCKQPADPGQGKAYIPSWYYNKKTKECERFIYGGCGGNDNRFKCERDCIRGCKIPERERKDGRSRRKKCRRDKKKKSRGH